MSSCFGGGASRTYSFDLDILKPPPPSPPSRSSSHSSCPSSTLSESSNSPIRISTKRARGPRKRPNQAYNEAAALLATLYPSVFAGNDHLRKFQKLPTQFNTFAEPEVELVQAFPAALSDAAFLLRHPPPPPAWDPLEQKPLTFLKFTCENSQNAESPCPGAFEDDGFHAESVLDEKVEEGMDSILGNYNNGGNDLEQSPVNQHLGSLTELRLAGQMEFGFGVGLGGMVNLERALRRGDDYEWWQSPAVAIRDIVPKFKNLSAAETRTRTKKKRKGKAVKVDKIDSEASLNSAIDATAGTTTSCCQVESLNLKPGLGLKLDYEAVVTEWSDRQCPYADAQRPESPESYARIAKIELRIDGGNEAREASVPSDKEKRTILFSQKMRYHVRMIGLNADRPPRIKGKFVRKRSILHEAVEEESR